MQNFYLSKYSNQCDPIESMKGEEVSFRLKSESDFAVFAS